MIPDLRSSRHENEPWRRKSNCKGTEAVECLVCSRNGREASVTGVEQERRRAVRNGVIEVTGGGQILASLAGLWEDVGVHPE